MPTTPQLNPLLRTLTARVNRPVAPPVAKRPRSVPPAAPQDGFDASGASQTYASSHGYPVFNQHDPSWAKKGLGKSNMSRKGCAVSSMAMALSGISGTQITPGAMDAYLKANGGLSGASINGTGWTKAGSIVQPPVQTARQHGFTADDVDKQLDQGKPVVIGVHYRPKTAASRSDHWILVTGKSPDGKTYYANNPDGGKPITLHREGNKLVADSGKPYRSTGDAMTFSRGPAGTS